MGAKELSESGARAERRRAQSDDRRATTAVRLVLERKALNDLIEDWLKLLSAKNNRAACMTAFKRGSFDPPSLNQGSLKE